MNNMIHTVLCGEEVTVFMQRGFFDHGTRATPRHRHGYCEIHIVTGGSVSYTVGESQYTLGRGDVLAIPASTYHSCHSVSDDIEHCSLMTDKEVESTVLTKAETAVADRLMLASRQAQYSQNYRLTVGCLSYIFAELFGGALYAEECRDDALIINDYIEKNYAHSPSLADLAAELSLSEKQTARLVEKYTGNSFGKEIARRRAETAELLITEGQMSKRQISEYVGYSSYSGFYKAWKKHKGNE